MDNPAQLPALASDKQALYVKARPKEVLQRLGSVKDDALVVRVSQDSFELKLVNKQKIHGKASALMAYNPIRASGKIQEYGYGSRIDLHISGKLTQIKSPPSGENASNCDRVHPPEKYHP